jgi:putative hydrolase of HD superfamily
MQEKVYPLVPEAWHPELKLFTEDEFRSVVHKDGVPTYCSSEEIAERYNEDVCNPRDGELIKAVDDLAAYMEALLAMENGIGSPELARASKSIKRKYEGAVVARIDFGRLYTEL